MRSNVEVGSFYHFSKNHGTFLWKLHEKPQLP